MAMVSLVYVSQAERHLVDRDVAEILAASRSYNAARAITGVLLFAPGRDGYRGSFMQLLEGEEAEVEALRRRIFADRRHHTQIVIDRAPVVERSFADWSMAFREVSDETLCNFPEFARLGHPGFLEKCERDGAPGALAFLKEFWEAEKL